MHQVHLFICFQDFFSKKQRNPFIILKHENQTFHKIFCTACLLETLLPKSHDKCDYHVTCIVWHQWVLKKRQKRENDSIQSFSEKKNGSKKTHKWKKLLLFWITQLTMPFYFPDPSFHGYLQIMRHQNILLGKNWIVKTDPLFYFPWNLKRKLCGKQKNIK